MNSDYVTLASFKDVLRRTSLTIMVMLILRQKNARLITASTVEDVFF